MEITGTQIIAAPREDVWNALNDPDVLKRCLPGCESAERVGPDEFRIVITAAIGPLRPRFTGSLRLTEAHPPSSCVMVFEGQGGAMGFGKGSAAVALHEEGAATRLAYEAQAQVGGKLAQVGARLIDSVARKMSDDFFKAFREQFVSLEAGDEARPTADRPAPMPSAVQQPAPPHEGTTAAPEAHSRAQATAPATQSHGSATTPVPAWWLIVAFALGVLATLAGVAAS